ncbi:signal recognition particle-docking protein FtsY [Acidihalobacter aeolianus]|uniref:Signal recognition particle receptor FtsY n=1 Tax=Acidihalobacter aeolianus TaxID=2792603 RepID=A0A1D8KAY9_9GAMM|nr:signal recognition particle-docking protein FtsY [Acidihalobacter aeolianus]AOV18138.1 signal recognition particle-docking protein FtsY [Acidihalobacter aeolianus]
MFGFIRRKKSSDPQSSDQDQAEALQPVETQEAAPEAIQEAPPKPAPPPQNEVAPPAEPAAAAPREGLFARLRKGLSKTGRGLTGGVGSLFLGRKAIDDELLEDLETRLLTADVGIEATTRIIDDLTARVRRKQLGDAEALFAALHENMSDILRPVAMPLTVDAGKRPFVILMVGINGAGKTTTIGKLAKHLQSQGKSVLLAAGDTFRAAAVEQLQAWGERNSVQVIAQGSGADSASVIFDGLQAARARGVDVLIADTAGRLHTQTNLMDELRKVKRVMAKLDPEAPHEVMLVVDAGIGQNALVQAREFHAALGLTGITVTKLDGTAKGGILFAIAQQIGIPIRFIGVGEAVDDLRPFEAESFVSALLAEPAPEDA